MVIRDARKLRGLTQVDVAKQAGIAQSTYSSIEGGSRKPSVKVAKRLGAVLGFDWTQFFEEVSDDESAHA